MNNFPMPNDKIEGQGTVVASVHYNDDPLATILVLRPEAPYFRVGVWNYESNSWDGDFYEDHYNIVPAIEGEGEYPNKDKLGYTDLGGDY